MWAGPLSGASVAAERLVWIGRWELLFSIVLFVLVFGLTRLLRDASPALRHALWGLVLLRLVLPVDLASPFSVGSLVSWVKPGTVAESTWLGDLPDLQTITGGAGLDGGARGAGRESASGGLAVVALWLVGAVAVGAVLVKGRRRYARVIQQAGLVHDDRARDLAESWRDRLGVRRAVRLVTSGELGTPFTLGNVRPVIYLPTAVLRHQDSAVLESVIGHEMAHIKRWDDLQLVFQLIVSALYYFNPVAWLAAGRMREESERICDALVVSRGGLAPATYGRSIVAVARLGLADEAGAILAMSAGKARLHKRIRSVMKAKAACNGGGRVVYSLPTAFALGAFLLPMAGGVHTDSQQNAEGPVVLSQQVSVALANPMPGSRVSAGWGPMRSPFTGEVVHHRGIDLVGRAGAEVHAAGDGVIEEATTEYSGGVDHGTVVVLDHGAGVKTFYSHLGSIAVQAGQRVAQGDVLGTQGVTGKTTGPHLHFEVWLSGVYVDPGLYVAEWRRGAPAQSDATDD